MAFAVCCIFFCFLLFSFRNMCFLLDFVRFLLHFVSQFSFVMFNSFVCFTPFV